MTFFDAQTLVWYNEYSPTQHHSDFMDGYFERRLPSSSQNIQSRSHSGQVELVSCLHRSRESTANINPATVIVVVMFSKCFHYSANLRLTSRKDLVHQTGTRFAGNLKLRCEPTYWQIIVRSYCSLWVDGLLFGYSPLASGLLNKVFTTAQGSRPFLTIWRRLKIQDIWRGFTKCLPISVCDTVDDKSINVKSMISWSTSYGACLWK